MRMKRDRRKYNQRYHNKNKEAVHLRQKRNHLLKVYGISLERFEQMRLSQNNRCAICQRTFKNLKDTNVDHAHDTDKVRALLCKDCNIGIGMFKENGLILKSAIEYLDKWRTK